MAAIVCEADRRMGHPLPPVCTLGNARDEGSLSSPDELSRSAHLP
jgi:hypothetical protein